jgi:hypothetical protein
MLASEKGDCGGGENKGQSCCFCLRLVDGIIDHLLEDPEDRSQKVMSERIMRV